MLEIKSREDSGGHRSLSGKRGCMTDVLLKEFLSDNERFADVVNGLGCEGQSFIKADDLVEMDSQTGLWKREINRNKKRKKSYHRKQKSKYRDLIRKASLGTNYVIIGVENQEYIDYLLPVRTMSYDVGEYERQAAVFRKKNRKNKQDLKRSEILSGFRRDDLLNPVVTFVLYYGTEEYDGPRDLCSLINTAELPDSLRRYVQNYKVNIIDIRKLKDTSVFQTDVKKVFDFIRYSKDKEKLLSLVEENPEYRQVERDTYEVIREYANVEGLLELDEDYQEGDKVNMCQALLELMADSKAEGKAENVLAFLLDLGEVKTEMKEYIMSQTDLGLLDGWVKSAARATSIQQFVEETGIAV